MRRTLALGAATALAILMSGCVPGGGTEPVEDVYGPPPTDVEDVRVDIDEDDAETQLTPSSSDEMLEDVYGPPPVSQDEGVEAEIPAIYGPEPV